MKNKKIEKKWFEDYYFQYTPKGGLEWRLPNVKVGPGIIRFRKLSDPRVKLLSDWLMCALYDLDALEEKEK